MQDATIQSKRMKWRPQSGRQVKSGVINDWLKYTHTQLARYSTETGTLNSHGQYGKKARNFNLTVQYTTGTQEDEIQTVSTVALIHLDIYIHKCTQCI